MHDVAYYTKQTMLFYGNVPEVHLGLKTISCIRGAFSTDRSDNRHLLAAKIAPQIAPFVQLHADVGGLLRLRRFPTSCREN